MIPFKVHAAHRLKVVAQVEEEAARKFIQSVANIHPGTKLPMNAPDVIMFNITERDFDRALQALTKRYGPIKPNGLYNSRGGSFFVDPQKRKRITISDSKFGGGTAGRGWTIGLLDEDLKESPREMMRRLMGPVLKKNPTM